jgi:cobalt-zinc-cadmium resistance protein CzcA
VLLREVHGTVDVQADQVVGAPQLPSSTQTARRLRVTASTMVLVAYLNQLVRDGIAVDEAAIRGASLRLRPVLMTALTTLLGLIPLLLASGAGSEVQRPLATVVVGGLVTSTMLTLLVLPALYKWFAVQVEPEPLPLRSESVTGV